MTRNPKDMKVIFYLYAISDLLLAFLLMGDKKLKKYIFTSQMSDIRHLTLWCIVQSQRLFVNNF
jgi:hypothetical protein